MNRVECTWFQFISAAAQLVISRRVVWLVLIVEEAAISRHKYRSLGKDEPSATNTLCQHEALLGPIQSGI